MNVFTFNNENVLKQQEDSSKLYQKPYNDLTYSSINYPQESEKSFMPFKITNYSPPQNQPCFASNKKSEQKGKFLIPIFSVYFE